MHKASLYMYVSLRTLYIHSNGVEACWNLSHLSYSGVLRKTVTHACMLTCGVKSGISIQDTLIKDSLRSFRLPQYI